MTLLLELKQNQIRGLMEAVIKSYYTFRTLSDISQIAARKTIFSFPKNISL